MKADHAALNQKVIAMINAGEKPADIIAKFNLTSGQFSGIRHRAKQTKQTKHVDTSKKDRAEDDLILKVIRLRASGFSLRKIANRVAPGLEWINNRTNQVLADDLEYSGEKPASVRSAYW